MFEEGGTHTMKRVAGFFVALVAVVSMILGVAALTPDTHAVNPKEVRCWTECFGPELSECCKYVVPGYGTWVECSRVEPVRYCYPI